MSNEQDQTGQPKYVSEFNKQTGKMLRTDTVTGQTWEWEPPTPVAKKSYAPKHGVTVEKLIALGHRVQISHMRVAVYHKQLPKLLKSKDFFTFGIGHVIVPSYFKTSPYYYIHANGGYTYVTVTSQDKSLVIHLTAECSQHDQFCYKAGVKTALERLSPNNLAFLAGGTPTGL